jgi:hypothetical protein
MSKPTRAAWDERLKCSVVSLAYDFRSHTGQLYLLDGDCCDMTGCVALFGEIDPKVTAINTYSGDQADTVYHKKGTEWSALLPRRP